MKIKMSPRKPYLSILDLCPNCDNHYYCKQLTIHMFLEALSGKNPKPRKLKCGKEITVRLKS